MPSRWRSPSFLAALLATALAATVTITDHWPDGGWKDTIRSDAKGYYGYLQALFIRGDIGNEPQAWEYVNGTPTGTLNKYFCGTAITMAPWFLLGHGLALLDPDAPRDGLSAYEMKALGIGGWTYLLLGLLALRALLRGMGVRESVAAWTIAGLGLGTPLLQYAAVQVGWSHVHSFCAIAVFLLLVHRLERGVHAGWAIAAAALLGLIVLVRPVNALVLLAVPVVAGRGTLPLLARLWGRPGILATALLAGGAVLFLQPLLWHAQTGNWIEWGYRNEGFHWDRPEVFSVLFSFRRGLFLWTPLLIPAALSAFLLLRRDPVRGAAALAYWAANTWVISCWWIWYYGSGFGSRVFIDHYPVLVLPMALVFQGLSPRWWTATRVYMALCIALHLAQYRQYRTGILHHECMDHRKYAFTFLRFGEAYRDQLGGCDRVPPFNPNGMDEVLHTATDLESLSGHWGHGRLEERPEVRSGKVACVLDSLTEYGITFTAPPGSLPLGRELHLVVEFWRYEEKARDSFHALAVVAIGDSTGNSSFYRTFPMNDLPGREDRSWERLTYRIPVPALREGEELSFYIWNQHLRSKLLLDDLSVRVWAVRPY